MSYDEKLESEATALPKPDMEAGRVADADMATVARGYKIGPITLPAYRSPLAQTIMIAFVCFLVVGMFNVIASLGGAGQVDATTSDNANIVLYSVFAGLGLVSGSICNYLGPKITLAIGGVGYALFAASFWSFNHTKNDGFVLFAGAACGFSAAFLWTAEGTMLMSYPTEDQKGRYISLFWVIWSMGAVIGSIIPTVENWSNVTSGSVNDGTYIALFILMLCGSIVALFLVHPSKVVRDDGTKVYVVQHASMLQELKNVVKSIRMEPWIILFFPYSFAGLWYGTYQSNDFNGYFFNVRTRSFNAIWYNVAQMVSAGLFGLFLDIKYFKRRTRAILGWIIMFVTLNAVLIGGIWPLRASDRNTSVAHPLDVQDSAAGGYIALYFFYGFIDGAWQCYAYWIMGTLSNDPLILSMYGAFYKVFGAVGSAIVASLDAQKKSYVDMFGSYWGLTAGAMIIMLPLVLKRVTNTSIVVENEATMVGAGGGQGALAVGVNAEVEGEELAKEKSP
ncbi:MFS general substrate transporter [Thozetella sp. PMI_491]|nr:MFS general substrate transporter [Thozetella sp. PMI_491]